MTVTVAALHAHARLDLDHAVVTFRPVPKTRVASLAWTIVLGACALPPALEDPKLQFTPYLSVYEVTGKTRMQSFNGGGGVVDNNSINLRDMGGGHHDEDVGGRVDVGDGFSTFRVDYLRLDANSSRKNAIPDDWGALVQGDVVHMGTIMDEVRVGYVNEVWHGTFGEKERQVDVRVGLGAVLGWRNMKMEVVEDNLVRQQTIHADDDGSIAPAVRARASLRGWFLETEYAISPEGWSFGGDFDSTQDLEVRIGYQIPLQDVAVYAGWRWSQYEISGTEGSLRHDDDLTLTGFQFGVVITL
jgi:hypothetical protein